MHNLQIGQMVSSIAGRDVGNNYLVIGTDGDIFVWVADGKYRRVENPKRKNGKHLLGKNVVVEEVVQRLHSGEKVTNSLVRKALSDLVAKIGEGRTPDQR